MFQGLANRDDSNSIVALRVGERDNNIYQKSESNVTRLAVVFARVLDGNQWTVKDDRCVGKVDAMFGEIELSLLFIPREHLSIYISYVM